MGVRKHTLLHPNSRLRITIPGRDGEQSAFKKISNGTWERGKRVGESNDGVQRSKWGESDEGEYG